MPKTTCGLKCEFHDECNRRNCHVIYTYVRAEDDHLLLREHSFLDLLKESFSTAQFI